MGAIIFGVVYLLLLSRETGWKAKEKGTSSARSPIQGNSQKGQRNKRNGHCPRPTPEFPSLKARSKAMKKKDPHDGQKGK